MRCRDRHRRRHAAERALGTRPELISGEEEAALSFRGATTGVARDRAPFLVLDIVVSATLMSMGMMMLPPIFISLPFKILLFVLVDGWNLVTESLVRSFG